MKIKLKYFILITIKIVIIDAQDGNAMQYFLNAEYFKFDNKPDSAIFYYQQAYQIDSLSLTILTNMADLYSKINEDNKAVILYKKILKKNKYDLNSGRKLLDYYLKREQNDEALLLLDSLLIYYPETIDLYYNLSQIYYNKMDWENLLQVYGLIYQLNPDNNDIIHTMFIIGIQLDRKDKLYQILHSILSDDSENQNALIALAHLRLLDDEFEAALKLFNHSYNLKEDPSILLKIVEICINIDRIDAANKYLSKYIKKYGKDFSSLQLLCEIYIYYNQLDSVFFVSKQLIELDKINSYGYEKMIYAGIQQNKYTDIEKFILEKIIEFPDEFIFQFLLGGIYYNWNRKDDAINYYYNSLLMSPENLEVKRIVAGISEETKNYILSDSLYLILINSDSSYALDMNNYAYSLSERPSADLDYALDLAKKAIKIEPENPAFLDTIGWIYFKLGYYENAIIFLEESIKLEPYDTLILEHLGDAYKKAGNFIRSEYNYRKILKTKPQSEVIQKKLYQVIKNE